MRYRTMRNHATSAIAVAAAVLALGPAACGGDGGSGAAPEEHTHAARSVTRWTDSLELFMEHPPQVAGEAGGAWGIHLTLLDGFRPVRQGELLLRFISPDGASHTARGPEPSSPGIYSPAPVVPEPGTYALELHLMRGGGRSLTVPAGSLRVYPSADSVPHQAAAAGDGISYLKEQQWKVPFDVAEARVRPVPRSVEVPGELEAPPDRTAKISAPVSGIVVADPSVPLPSVGTAVERGADLTVLAPTGSESSYATLHARVERLERQVARERRLVEAEAIPEKRLVESRHHLRVARAALDAVGGPSTVSRAEGAGGSGTSDDGGAESAYRYRVRSPIAGVVAGRSASPGQRVEAGERLFTVVDPSTLRLRLQVPARKVPRATPATGASFRVEGGDEVHRAGRVVSVGSVLDPDTRTLPVLLSVPNPERRLKVGMMATARLFAGDTVRGTAVPSSAIQEEANLHVAYVQTGGESFERRVLELGPTDGRWTIVRSGISPGEHVVTRGAFQVRLASEGTGSDAAAHGHPH